MLLEEEHRRGEVERRGVFARVVFFFFSSRRRHTRCSRDWSSDVCSSDLLAWFSAKTGLGRSFRCQPGQAITPVVEAVEEVRKIHDASRQEQQTQQGQQKDRKSTRLNSSHGYISYAVFCLKKKKKLDDMQGHHKDQTLRDLWSL